MSEGKEWKEGRIAAYTWNGKLRLWTCLGVTSENYVLLMSYDGRYVWYDKGEFRLRFYWL